MGLASGRIGSGPRGTTKAFSKQPLQSPVGQEKSKVRSRSGRPSSLTIAPYLPVTAEGEFGALSLITNHVGWSYAEGAGHGSDR